MVPTDDSAMEVPAEQANDSDNDAPDTDDADVLDADDEGTNDDDPEGADALGDPGKKALDAMKAKWREERRQRRELEAQLKGVSGSVPDEKVAEAIAKANTRIVRSEVKLAAKGKLADPDDAFRFLDLDTFDVDENGDVDADEISEAVDELLKNKPYLGLAQGGRFKGSADQGTRKGSQPRQLTREDLRGMTPQQISDAKAKGQLKNLLNP